jgi:FkbM family methyltransferase
MLIDSRDTSSGLNIITTGYIEPNVMKLLQKSFMPGSVFLDVGANFGFYTVMAGAQVGVGGQIYSFEANPFLVKFIDDNVRINGISNRVTIINKAVSDRSGIAQFGFSYAGTGGGSLWQGEGKTPAGTADQLIEVPLVRIDDVLPPDLSVDCVKLDIEGAELAALRGMSDVVARSPSIKIVLEFFPPLLAAGSGGAGKVLDALEQMGLDYWRIDDRGHLDDVSRDQLVNGSECYLVAARAKPDDRILVLNPDALRYPSPANSEGILSGAAGAVLVHGPYWYLPAGTYDVEIEGEIQGTIEGSLAHEFGFALAAQVLNQNNRSFGVALPDDVRYFEVVLRSAGPGSKLKLNRILLKERV